MITQQRLRELLYYDKTTGLFIWRASNRGLMGRIAGYINVIDGYVRIKIDGKTYLAHVLAWLYVKGVWPSKEIDHKDTVRCHNWFDNLRQATRSQNRANCRLYKNNTNGIKGVYRVKKGGWQIQINGRTIGYRPTFKQAVAYSIIMRRRMHGEFWRHR